MRDKPDALLVTPSINQLWSMDFMHGQVEDGRTFQLLNAMDGLNPKAIGLEIDFSMPSEHVNREL